MPTINIAPKAMQNGDNVTTYKDTVGPQQQTYTFLTSQERVILKNSGSKNITYTVGSQSGTLGPSQMVDVKETISSINLTAEQGTQQFEIWADESGTKGTSPEAVQSLGDQVSSFASSLAESAQQVKDISVSVKDKQFGAKGDGVTDDTVAIQNAINSTLSINGGRLYFPSGTYKITSPITISLYTSFVIEGQSRGAVTIKQFTDNMPIFKFTRELAHSWCIREITFDYNNHQPNTNTLAIPIYFELPSGTATGSGMFNFLVDRCSFIGGYYGIMQTQQSQQLPLWGVHIKDSAFGGYLSGGAINIDPVPAIGQPIIKLEDVYIDASHMTKFVIAIYNSDTVLLDSVEINGGSIGNGNTLHIEIQTCQNVVLLNTRCESVTINGTNAVWDFPNSYVTVIGCSQSLIAGASAVITGINAGSNGRLSVHGFNFGYSSLGSGATGFAIQSDDMIVAENLNIPSSCQPAFSRYRSYVTPPRLDMLYIQPNKTKFQGDISVTLTSGDLPLQYFNTAFTVNRTITLPSTGLYDGMTFTIVKYNTSAFTLLVNDPLSAKNITIPASTKASVTYRAVGTGEWLPTQYSTFA
jgi:hypothetical protein